MSQVQMRAISSIVIDPDLSMAMPVDPKIVAQLAESMKTYGFLTEHPIIVWFYSGLCYLIDGRSRLKACRPNRIAEVPVVVKSFGSWAEARSYAIKCQVERRGMEDPVILWYLLHVHLYGRGGKRISKVKGSTGPLIGGNDDTEVSLEDIAKELSVSLRRLKRVKRDYYDTLTKEKRQMLRDEEMCVYDLFPRRDDREARDEDHGSSADQSAADYAPRDTDKEARRSTRRKSGDILLQKLALTDEEISAVQDKLKQQNTTVKDLLTRLVRCELAAPEVTGTVPEIADNATDVQSAGDTGSDARLPSPHSGETVGDAEDQTKIVHVLAKVSAEPGPAEKKAKTWNGWNHDTLTALGCFLSLHSSHGKTNLELSAEFAQRWNSLAKSNFTPKAIEHKLVAARDLVAQAAIVDFPDKLASLEVEARASAGSD